MKANIELKARLDDIRTVREVAERIATEPSQVIHQVDTYFSVENGRLKMRVIDGREGQLVWYFRPDVADSKESRYLVTPIAAWRDVQETLAGANGVLCCVTKRREVSMFRNVRIHLDRVENLGEFLEFEAVLGPDCDARQGLELVNYLRGEFAIRDDQLIEGSYSDLLLAES